MSRNKRPPKAPPTGVITAMFTDMVNSTKLKAVMEGDTTARRDAKFRSDIKELHDKIVLTCAEEADGHKVNSTGDGYCFIFTDPEEAVLCALRIQGHLCTNPINTPLGPLQVRIGLHTGIASPTGGDYIASMMDKAARVQSKAEPGQVFVSRETQALVNGKLRGVAFRKAGTFELKKLEAEDLYRAFRTGVKALDAATPRVGYHDALPDPDTHVFHEVEVRLSDTWQQFRAWLAKQLPGASIRHIQEDRNQESSFYCSGKPGHLNWPIFVSGEKAGSPFKQRYDLVRDWLHPIALDIAPSTAAIPWDSSLFPVKDSEGREVSIESPGVELIDYTYWVLFATTKPAADEVPENVRGRIESAESCESTGDVWSAARIYESLWKELNDQGNTRLAGEMRRRARANRSAAACMMRGDT